MFNYLKQETAKMTASYPNPDSHIPTEVLLEYTSLFQELDEMSAGGTGGEEVDRSSIDIPLDNDVEVNSIEVNLDSNEIMDGPKDAAVQEAKYIRTFNSFYQEACEVIQPFSHRESEASLDERRNKYAMQLQNEYVQEMKLDGVSGFANISIKDESVPSVAKIDFGSIRTSLPIAYGLESGGILTQKQLDTVGICESYLGRTFSNSILYQEIAANEDGTVGMEDDEFWLYVLGVLFISPIGSFIVYKVFESKYKKENFGEILKKGINFFNSKTPEDSKVYKRILKRFIMAMKGLKGVAKKQSNVLPEINSAITKAKQILKQLKSGNFEDTHKELISLNKEILDKIGGSELAKKEVEFKNSKDEAVKTESAVDIWEDMRPVRLCIPTNYEGTFKAKLIVETFATGEIDTYTLDIIPEMIQECGDAVAEKSKDNNEVKTVKECGADTECKTVSEYNTMFTPNKQRPSRFSSPELVQEGLFAPKSDKSKAPQDITLSLTKDKDVKIPILYQTIGNSSKIYDKQAILADILIEEESFQEIFINKIEEDQMNQFAGRLTKKQTIWDLITFKHLAICFAQCSGKQVYFYFKLENEYRKQPYIYGWVFTFKTSPSARTTSSFDAPKAITSGDAEKRSEGLTLKPFSGDMEIIQEGIDFGDGGGEPTADASQQPAATPQADAGGDQAAATPPPAEGGQPEVSADATKVDNNDVSDQIAQNVANQQDGASAEGTEPTDGELGGSPEGDGIEFNTNPGDPDPEAALADLDAAGGEEMDLEEGDPTEVGSMTINQLLKAGQERLKNMSMEELQSFIGDVGADAVEGDEETQLEFASNLLSTICQEAVISGNKGKAVIFQEALFLNKKNIDKEIKEKLATALGILNNSEMEITQIFTEFKKAGKALNKVLSKGSKMKKVYSEEQCTAIGSLNKVLVDLMSAIKTDKKPTESEAQVIRRLLQEFISQTKVVDKILGEKGGDK